MRFLGPARVVTAPDGTRWEIYASRFQLPTWRPVAYEGTPGPGFGSASLGFVVVDAFLSLIYDLLIPLLRVLVTAPWMLIRSSRSPRRRIEALTLWPHEERYVWETDARDVERVVDGIAAGLRRGTFAQPAEAIFRGRHL